MSPPPLRYQVPYEIKQFCKDLMWVDLFRNGNIRHYVINHSESWVVETEEYRIRLRFIDRYERNFYGRYASFSFTLFGKLHGGCDIRMTEQYDTGRPDNTLRTIKLPGLRDTHVFGAVHYHAPMFDAKPRAKITFDIPDLEETLLKLKLVSN